MRAFAMLPLGLVLLAGTARAVGQMPDLPKPGPEHQVLQMEEGVWEATVEFTPAPGVPAMTTRAVETNTLGCGGLCLVTDFRGDLLPGIPFQGHGLLSWDPVSRTYRGSWADSMSHGIFATESTWDPKSRRLTGWMEGADPSTGSRIKMQTTTEFTDTGRVFTARAPGAGGQERQVLKVTYTKRK